MDVNDILTTIEDRVKLGRNLKTDAILTEIIMDGYTDIYVIGCVIDPSKITFDLINDVKAFNDEALNEISFTGGKMIQQADNVLFMLMFTAQQQLCNT